MSKVKETFSLPFLQNGKAVTAEIEVTINDHSNSNSAGYMAVMPYNLACHVMHHFLKGDINNIYRSNFEEVE
jgi:hypothetical protein